MNGSTKKFLHPDSTDTLTNKTIDGGSNTLTNIGNSSLSNSSITIQGSAVSLGGSALATSSTPQFLRLGLNQAADASAPLAVTGAANNITLFQLKRNTDTSPTGNFADFQNAAGSSLWKVDITGSLGAGTVPVARVSGLAASATTDTTNATNISSGTLAVARTPVLDGSFAYNSANQSIPDSTATAITFDTEGLDDGNLHSTASQTDRFTAATAGKYTFTCTVNWAANATGFRTTSVRLNGTTLVAANTVLGTSATSQYVNVSVTYKLAAGDYLSCYAFQTSGGALNALGSGSPSFTSASIQFVSR